MACIGAHVLAPVPATYALDVARGGDPQPHAVLRNRGRGNDILRRLRRLVYARLGGDQQEPQLLAEAVEIIFDPARISYRQLLELFFQIHDPTTRNRQGGDVGSSYRSAIFYASDEQKRVAEDTIADVDASGLWPGKAVTEVVPAGDFWEAEEVHQDFLIKYPDGYTCHWPRASWVLPRRNAAE